MRWPDLDIHKWPVEEVFKHRLQYDRYNYANNALVHTQVMLDVADSGTEQIFVVAHHVVCF